MTMVWLYDHNSLPDNKYVVLYSDINSSAYRVIAAYENYYSNELGYLQVYLKSKDINKFLVVFNRFVI